MRIKNNHNLGVESARVGIRIVNSYKANEEGSQEEPEDILDLYP
jgi:hypothetical protein